MRKAVVAALGVATKALREQRLDQLAVHRAVEWLELRELLQGPREPFDCHRAGRGPRDRQMLRSTYSALKGAAGALDAWERERDAARATVRAEDQARYLHALLGDGDNDLAWHAATAAPPDTWDADLWLLVGRPGTFDRKLLLGVEPGRMVSSVEVGMRPPEVFVRELSPEESVRLRSIGEFVIKNSDYPTWDALEGHGRPHPAMLDAETQAAALRTAACDPGSGERSSGRSPESPLASAD